MLEDGKLIISFNDDYLLRIDPDDQDGEWWRFADFNAPACHYVASSDGAYWTLTDQEQSDSVSQVIDHDA